MKILFELSKEHPTLPREEALSCLEAEAIPYKIMLSNEDVLLVEIKEGKIERLAERLSLTFFIDELLFYCSPSIEEIKSCAQNYKIEGKGSVAIRYRKRSNKVDSQSIVKAVAGVYTKNRQVNLTRPDLEIRLLITDANLYVGIKRWGINRKEFEKRKVQYRPFFSPISIHPKIARTLVNLSRIKRNKKLLDPFCGTGGILIEAGLIGAKVIGSDIDKKMIEGCRRTLDFYGIKNYKLFCCDVGEINFINKVDAIVTDLPYGKSTSTRGEEIKELYSRAFESFSRILKGRAVIGLPDKKLIEEGERYLSLVKDFELRVHKSLTRYFAVYE